MKTLNVYTQKEFDSALKVVQHNYSKFRFSLNHNVGNDILEDVTRTIKDYINGTSKKVDSLYFLDRYFPHDHSTLILSYFKTLYPVRNGTKIPLTEKMAEDALNAFAIVPKKYSEHCFEVTIQDAVEPITVKHTHGIVTACSRSCINLVDGTLIVKDFARVHIEPGENPGSPYAPHVFAFDHSAVDSNTKSYISLNDRAQGISKAGKDCLSFYALDSSELCLHNKASGVVCDTSKGFAYNCAKITSFNSALIELFDISSSFSSGSSLIKACHNSLVSLQDNATAEGYDSAILISSKPMNTVRHNKSSLVIPDVDSPQALCACVGKIIDHPSIHNDYVLACRVLFQSADCVSKKCISGILANINFCDPASVKTFFASAAETESRKEAESRPAGMKNLRCSQYEK